MLTPRTAPRSRSLALVILLAFIASACSSAVAESNADRSSNIVVTGENASPLEGLAPANAPEYGASLDEWAETVPQPDTTAPQAEPETAHGFVTGDAGEAPASSNADVEVITWDDLIPEGFSGQEIVARFEDRLAAVEIGSEEATVLYEQMQAEFDSGAVNDELNGTQVRLAGFVAPLTYEDDIVTEFLLVPNFGACIHVPPPPPNQTVMITVDKADGLTLEEAWGPVWVEGTIVVESTTTELAAANYSILGGVSGVYNDF